GAGIILLIGCLVVYKGRIFDFSPRLMAWMMLHGIIGFGGMSCFIFMGQREANALNSVMIMAMVPALTTICSLFTKYRPNWLQLTAMGISTFGCLLVVGVITPGGVHLSAFGRGEFLVLLAAFCWVFYTFSGRIMVPKVGVMIYTLYGMLAAAAAIGILLFWGVVEAAVFPTRSIPWLVMGYLILCPTLAAFVCWNTAQKYIDLSLQTIMQYLAPVTVMLLAGPILDEQITPLDIVGAIILIGGMCFNVAVDKFANNPAAKKDLTAAAKVAAEIGE
ncbi:MAG: DMT family transporter, partial [Victivallaceae bacterium]